MRSRPSAILLPLVLASLPLAAGACSGSGANSRTPLEVPNAVSGGTRGGGRPDSPSLERMAESEAIARTDREREAAAERAEEQKKADELWNAALRKQASDPEDAADDFKELAEKHKTSPHAEEARWLAADGYFRAGEWNDTIGVLEEYLKTNPVNPHLPQVERMLYESSIQVFAGARGFSGIFRSRQKGYDGLKAIVERVPEGAYADDALLALGDQYVDEMDYETAALQYRNILLRYPDSEWSFRARLKLADAYLARDQGPAYHAGYVDIDPRTPVTPQSSASRPVRSVVEAALEQYQAFLDRIAADPGRRAEYANEVAYAERKVIECRQRLADKDRTIAQWCAGRGQATAAATYERFATNAVEGRTWCSGFQAGATPSPSSGTPPSSSPRPPPAPAPLPPSVTRPPLPPPPAPMPAPVPTPTPPPPPSPYLPPSVLPPPAPPPPAPPPGSPAPGSPDGPAPAAPDAPAHPQPDAGPAAPAPPHPGRGRHRPVVSLTRPCPRDSGAPRRRSSQPSPWRRSSPRRAAGTRPSGSSTSRASARWPCSSSRTTRIDGTSSSA